MKNVGFLILIIFLFGSCISFDRGKKAPNFNSENLEPQIRIKIGHSFDVNSLAFSPDGRYLASGSDDRSIKVWQVRKGDRLHILEGHTSFITAVTTVAFSPDGRYLASGSSDETIKIWDVERGELLVTFIALDREDYICYTEDGYFEASPGVSPYLSFYIGTEECDFKKYETVYRKSDIISERLRLVSTALGDGVPKLAEEEDISPLTDERIQQLQMQSLFAGMLEKIRNNQTAVIVVSGYHARSGNKSKFIDLLNEAILSEVEKTGTLVAIGSDILHGVLKEQRRSSPQLLDASVAISLGKSLAAQYILTATVIEMSESVVISGRIIDVETSQVEVVDQISLEKNKHVEALLQSK
jgi:WD40 repeat protein